MNKITKIWALALALCALLVSLYASADPTASKQNKLSLILTKPSDSCTMEDYSLGSFTVSISAQATQTASHPVSCSMRGNPTQTVSIALLTWLTSVAANETIGKANFSFSLTNPTVTWSLTNWTTVNNTFAEQRVLYNKGEKKIWIWTWTLAISWTIPASTPSWTYTWELNLVLQ